MQITYRKVKALLSKPYSRTISIKPETELNFRRVTLTTSGDLQIEKGYVWDFASGAFDDDSIKEASLVHDALCELIHNDLLSYHMWGPVADIMRRLMDEYAESHSAWLRRPRMLRAAYVARAIKFAGPEVTRARKYLTV